MRPPGRGMAVEPIVASAFPCLLAGVRRSALRLFLGDMDIFGRALSGIPVGAADACIAIDALDIRMRPRGWRLGHGSSPSAARKFREHVDMLLDDGGDLAGGGFQRGYRAVPGITLMKRERGGMGGALGGQVGAGRRLG